MTSRIQVPAGFTETFISTRIKSMTRAFTHPRNIEYLRWKIGSANTSDGAPIAEHVLDEQVPLLVNQFASTYELDNFSSVTRNWLEALNYLNTRFIRQTYTQLRGGAWTEDAVAQGQPEPDANMMRATINGVAAGDAMVDDIRAIDAYNYSREILRDNNRPYRNRNKIRGWEANLIKRHYDYHDTEGFPDTRDLEVPQRGFDMTAIHRVATTYDQRPRVPAIDRAPGYGESYYQDTSNYD